MASRQHRFVAVAAALLVTLSACGQGVGNPRLRPIGVTGGSPATASPTPSAVVETPAPVESPTSEPPTAEPPTAEPPTDPGPPPCPGGDYQLEVETALEKIGSYGRVTIDGAQSALDCATIIAFQTRMGIEPNDGTPGPTTVDVANRIAATDVWQCPLSDAPVACVDLTNQTFYITRNAIVVLGPTVTRTGMPGWATPAGDYPIGRKAGREWSVPFSVWLPYWQQFYFGDGLHETTTYIHNMWNGSHGCVNLLPDDAQNAYGLLTIGSTVHLYGRRPNT